MGYLLRLTLLLALLLLAAAPVCTGADRGAAIVPRAAPATEMGLGSYHAVLIGINNYTGGLPKLKTPINDVERLARVLGSEYGFEDVTLITDKTPVKPTASGIVKELRSIAQRLTEKDNLLIYYAGHGNIDELTKEGYWVPIDGKKDDPTTWISHSLIRNLLETEKVRVKNFVLIADSCYSGTMMRRSIDRDAVADGDEETLVQKLKERAAMKSREVITSGGNEPVADEAVGTDHSLFAYYLIKALERNQKRYTDLASLFNMEVQPNVDKRGKQRPDRYRVQSVTDEDGLFVLAKLSVAERPKKPNVQDELARMSRENEEMRRQLEQERHTAAQKDAALQKLTREKLEKEKETEQIKKTLDQEKKRLASERASYQSGQDELRSMRERLREQASRNQADQERTDLLMKDAAHVPEKLAALEKERLRLQQEKQKIADESARMKEKERQQATAEERLKKEEAARAKTEREHLARLEQIRTEQEKLEEARRQAEVQRMKAEEALRSEMLKVQQKKDELEKRVKQIEEMAEESRTVPVSNSNGRFIVSGKVVIDTKTRLMWLKNANLPMRGMEMADAMEYVDNFKYEGYGDWRIPTKEDWQQLIDKPGGIEASYPEGHPFSNVVVHSHYWSSSVNPLGLNHAYVINVARGSVSLSKKNNVGFIWPVRDVSLAELKKAVAAAGVAEAQ